MASSFKGNVFACLLLVGSVVALPVNIRQNAAFAFSQDSAKQQKSEFLPPMRMTKPALLQMPMLRGEVDSRGNSSASTARAIAFHIAASTTATGATSGSLAIGCVFVILIVACVYFALSREEESDLTTVSSARGYNALVALENCEGAWARTYKNAKGDSKQGLELLFRCHIIPPEEFANSQPGDGADIDQNTVSQGHIDECVWIATVMLHQKPLEQWLQVPGDAQKTFEEHVTSMYEERKELRTGYPDTLPAQEKDNPKSPLPVVEHLPQQTTPPRAESVKSLGRSSLSSSPVLPHQDPIGMSGSSVCSVPSTLRSSKADFPVILQTPEDANSLLTRCRRIMAASDSQRKPWSSMPAIPSSGQAVQETQNEELSTSSPNFAPPTRGSPPTAGSTAGPEAKNPMPASANF